MANCLAGCMSDYKRPPLNVPGEGPGIINQESASPVVIVEFKSGDFTIKVGNESAPDFGHDACITSFEYGYSDGYRGTIEILDIQGGILSNLLDNVTKCAKKASEEVYSAKFTFGWVYTDCNGNSNKLGLDFWVTAQVAALEVSYTQGKIKYRVECADPINTCLMMREDGVFGDDEKPIHLEDAIRDLCMTPPAVEVQFCEKQPDGSLKCDGLDWRDHGEKGPKAVYRANSLDKLSAARHWLEPFQTSKDKGVFAKWDNSSMRTLQIFADWRNQDCDSEGGNLGWNLGTFIVNGGKCSNVIEFQPNFKWIQAFGSLSSGGETHGATDGGTEQKEKEAAKCEESQGPNVGTQEQVVVSEHSNYADGKESGKNTNSGQSAQSRASRHFGTLDPINAELTIIGNPDYIRYVKSTEGPHFFSLVAINPFHLSQAGNNSCGDWLAKPGCNQVLSNKNWKSAGINHAIQAGSYHTTIKAVLDLPGLDVMPGKPLGGDGSKGYTPKNTCQ